MRAPVLLIIFAALLASCGYKGALYLPQEPAAQKPAAPQQKPDANKQSGSPSQ
ncbi:MAG: LPS translocon maturation chaperone LptM [Burkholderiales bacterium]